MKKLTGIGLLFSLLTSFSANALYLSPHAGVDWKYWGARPNNDMPLPADHTFPPITNAFSFYLGTRINGFFGLDVGYDQSTTKEESRVFNGQQTFLQPVPEPIGNSSTVRTRFKAWYMHGIFYWQAMPKVAPEVELLGLLGISTLKPDTHIYYVTGGQRVEIIQNTKSKASARIGLGLQYNPFWFVGLRAMVIWDQTKRVNYLGVDQNQTPFDLSPYKSAASYHLGFVINMNPPRDF